MHKEKESHAESQSRKEHAKGILCDTFASSSRRCGMCFVFLFGCSAPALAESALWLDSTVVEQTTRPIGPGVLHHQRRDPAGPWLINIIEIDRRNVYLRFETAKAGNRLRAVEKTSAMAATADAERHRVVAAINGDFFDNSGMPINLQVRRGELLRGTTEHSVFAVTETGAPLIDIFRMTYHLRTADGKWRELQGFNRPRLADEAILYTPRFGGTTGTNQFGSEARLQLLSPFLVNDTLRAVVRERKKNAGNASLASSTLVISAHGASQRWLDALVANGDTVLLVCALRPTIGKIVEALGGLPRIVRNGKVSVETDREGGANFANVRHPRTAIGFSSDSSRAFLVTVDGRQSTSVGMTLDELAELMLSLGCAQALNLDGGGSTTMVVRGGVVNHPSDASGERPVGNALLLISRAPTGPVAHLNIDPPLAICPVGETVDFSVMATDSFFNPLSFNDKSFSWRLSRKAGLGEIDGKGKFTAHRNAGASEDSGYVFVSQRPGPIDSAKVVVTSWREIKVEADSLVLHIGASRALQAALIDSRGRVYKKLPGQFEWEVDGKVGRISSAGVFTATANGSGTIRVRFKNNVEKRIPVVIGARSF